MSDLPMKQENHPIHNMPTATQDYRGVSLDVYGTEGQVNVSKKTDQAEPVDPLPNTDDNMFFASGRDEKIIRAKRQMRDMMK